MKIMVIDDDEIDRERYRRFLNESGYNDITEFSFSDDALERLHKDQSFTCILVDYRMPRMDGLTFAKAVNDIPNFSPVVIMLTGEGNETIARDSLKMGIHEYLIKNEIDADSLHNAIEISHKKQYDQKIEQEKYDASMQFSHMAAHDLKAPLRTIKIMNDLLEKNLTQSQTYSSEVKMYIDKIRSGCEYSFTLIEGLLSYVKSGHSDHPFEYIDLIELLHEVVNSLHGRIADKKAKINIDGDLSTIVGDRIGLRQVFQNIIDNGLKFVDASTAVISVNIKQEKEGLWTVIIQDNGIGIEEKHKDEIFKPLRRLNASSKFEGTGLGLASCKRIIERHNGKIWVESEVGKGTTFFISLPENQPSTHIESVHKAI